MDFGAGFISDLAGSGLSELVTKYGAKHVANGLKKLNMSDSFIKKVTGIDLNGKKTPVSTYAGYQNPASSSNKGAPKAKGSLQAGRYAPERELPRTKHGDPIPDTDVPHTQLGKRDDGNGPYNQARTWKKNTNGKGITAIEDIDFSDHMSPDLHPNPHKHKLTPNNPKTAPKGGYKRGGPEPFKY